jgi:hypothetical protein
MCVECIGGGVWRERGGGSAVLGGGWVCLISILIVNECCGKARGCVFEGLISYRHVEVCGAVQWWCAFTSGRE